MPRYFFDSFNGSASIDDEGQDLSDLDAVLGEVRRALPSMLAEDSGEKDDAQCRIEVRDAAGQRMVTGTLSMIIVRA